MTNINTCKSIISLFAVSLILAGCSFLQKEKTSPEPASSTPVPNEAVHDSVPAKTEAVDSSLIEEYEMYKQEQIKRLETRIASTEDEDVKALLRRNIDALNKKTPTDEELAILSQNLAKQDAMQKHLTEMQDIQNMMNRETAKVREIDISSLPATLIGVTKIKTIGAVVEDSKDEALFGSEVQHTDLLPYYVEKAFDIEGHNVHFYAHELHVDKESMTVVDGEMLEDRHGNTLETKKVCDSSGERCVDSDAWTRVSINGTDVEFWMNEVKEIRFENDLVIRIVIRGYDDVYFSSFLPKNSVIGIVEDDLDYNEAGSQPIDNNSAENLLVKVVEQKTESAETPKIFFYQRSNIEHLSQKDPMLLRTMLAFKPFKFDLPHPSLDKKVNILVGDNEILFRAVDIFDLGDGEKKERICLEDKLGKVCPENKGVIAEIGGVTVLLPEDDLLVADVLSGERIWISAEEIGIDASDSSIISITQFQPTAPKQKEITIRLADGNKSDSESIQKDSGMSDVQKQAKRKADLQIISTFLLQYKITNGMQLPFESPQDTPIAFCKHGAVDCVELIDVRDIFYDYNKEEFPVDPDASSENSAEYFVEVGSDGKATISAPNASEEMSVTR